MIGLFLMTVALVSGVACTAAAQGSTVTIDKHNRVILNGEPFFPLGLYVAQCSIDDQSSQLNEIQDSPFDTLMNYAINTCGNTEATEPQINSYLDQLQSRGLKIIFSLAEYFSPCNASNTECENPLTTIEIESIMEQKVTAFGGDSAIIGWYMNDEVCPACLSKLEAGYGKIRELDQHHPVWSVHWNAIGQNSWLLQEAHTTDIVGVDPYPIDNNPITLVSEMANAATKTGKPLWLVPQIFSWTDDPGDSRAATGRPPTREEMRAMTYLAVNHGAKGIIYYSYFNIRDDADYNTRWPQIKKIASEIDQLRPVFLSIHQANENHIVSNNGNIDFKLMWEGGTYYLLAVNTKVDAGGDPVQNNSVSFQINLANKPAVFDTLFEDPSRQIPVGSGTVTDDFGPYEVHVYHWQGDFEEGGDGDGASGDADGGGGCFISTAAFGS